MANNNRIVYNLDFKANLTNVQGQIDRLKQSLNTITANSVGTRISNEMKKGAQAASTLSVALQKAFNVDTGRLDLTRFNLQLKSMGYSLDTLSMDLVNMGTQGKRAFMELSLAMSNSQQKIFSLNGLAKQLFTTLGNTLRWQISSVALTSLYSGISKAVTFAKDLNKTLNDIRIVTGDSAEQMDRFTKSAGKMAKEVGSTTLEVAKANLIYRQQGDAAELSARKAEITTKAANVAFDVSAKDMSQYLTAIWNSYQVGEENLELFVDKLAYVGATTATDMAEIATSMEKVAATANTVGVSYDQLLATVSTVSSVTRQSAEQVGTAFKTIYARMGDLKLKGSVEDEDGLSVSLGQVSEQLGQVGIHILDANGQIRDMGYIVEELGNKWKTMSDNEQTAIAQAVGGKRQYTQVMALFENWDMYRKTLEGVAGAQGTLTEQNEIFKESWEGALNDIKVEWEKLVLSLVNDDFIINFIQGFSKIVEEVTDTMEVIDGFKGILLITGSILLRTFGPQIANSLTNLTAGFLNAFGAGKKLNQALLEQNQRTIDNLVANKTLTQQEGEQLKIINELGLVTKRFNEEKKRMSEPVAFAMESALNQLRQNLERTSVDLINIKQEYQDILRYGSINQNNFRFNTHVDNTQIKSLAVELEKMNYDIDLINQNLIETDAAIARGFSPEDILYFAEYLRDLRNHGDGLEQDFKQIGQEIKNFNGLLNKNYSGQSLKQLKKDLKNAQQELSKTQNDLRNLYQSYNFSTSKNDHGLAGSIAKELIATGGNLDIVKQKFMDAGMKSSVFERGLKNLKNVLANQGGYDNFIKKIQGLIEKTKLSKKEVKDLENAIKNFQKTEKQKLSLPQQLTQFASSLMNAQMVMSSLNSFIDTMNDKTASFSDKFSSGIYLISTSMFSLAPAIQAATAATGGLTAAMGAFLSVAWPLLAIGLVVGVASWIEKTIITAKEAKENLKELSAEYEDLKNQFEENENKKVSLNTLVEEYEELIKLKSVNALLAEDEKRLAEIEEELNDTYDIKIKKLNDLTSGYDDLKNQVEDYNKELDKNSEDIKQEIFTNVKETIKNQSSFINDTNYTENESGETKDYDSWFVNGKFQDFSTTDLNERDKIVSVLKEISNDYSLNENDYKVFENARSLDTKLLSENAKKALESYYNSYSEINDEENQKIRKAQAENFNKYLELEVENFNVLEDTMTSYLSNKDGYGYKLITEGSDEEQKKYAQKLKQFSKDYEENIKKIADNDEYLKSKMSERGLNDSEYDLYYENILNQMNMVSTLRKENIIDVDTEKEKIKELNEQIKNNAALNLEYLARNVEGLTDSEYFNSLQQNVQDLNNEFSQGKITQAEYFNKLIEDSNNAKQAFGKNKAAMGSYFESIAMQGQNALTSLISSYKSGKVSTMDFIDQLSSLTDSFASLEDSVSSSMEDMAESDGFNNLSNKLSDLKQQLLNIKSVLPMLSREANKTTKELAKGLDKAGITAEDVKKTIKKENKDIENITINTSNNSEAIQTLLENTTDSYGTAQEVVMGKYKTTLYNIGLTIGNIIQSITKYLGSMELSLEGDFKKFLKGEGTVGLNITTSGSISSDQLKSTFDKSGAKSSWGSDLSTFVGDEQAEIAMRAAISGMSEEEFYNTYRGETNERSRAYNYDTATYNRMKTIYSDTKKLGLTDLGISLGETLANTNVNFNDLFGTTTSGKPPAGDGDDDKFDPESLIEAKVSDLIDKYRTIQEVIFEALENEGDMLDENIDGWEKIITNQTEQNAMRDVLIDGEKKIQEGLNTLLNELITSTGYSLEEISKWFNSEGEETAYYKALRNAQGSDDAAEALDKVFEDFQAVWQALIESNEKLSEHAKGKIDDIKELREKIVSGAEKVIADYDYEIEKLNQEDFIDYGSIRNLIYAKIKATEDLIRYYLSQGILEDSEIIQGLKQKIWGYEKDLVESYDDEFEQSKKQLNEIYKEIEYQNKKKSEALQDEITQRQKILDLEKKHNSAMKELRQTQRDINKELISSKMSVQWLDKETRELLFNQNDYYEITSKVSEIQSYLNDLYVNYNTRLATLGEDELYLADSITKEYEAQVAAKKEELAILKASLDLEKKRNALNTALSERNVRVFAGGRWRQVANQEAVSKAYQDLMDTQNEIAEKQLESAENSAIRQEEAEIRRLEDLKKTYDEQTKMMKEKIEEMEHNWNILNSDLNLAGKSIEQLTSMFSVAIDEMNLNIEAWSASRNKLKQGDYSELSNPGYQLTAEQIKAVNDIIWYKGEYDKADVETRKAIEAAVIPLYEKLPSNIITALKGMGYQEAFGAYKGGQYQATESSYAEKIINNKKSWYLLEEEKKLLEEGNEEQRKIIEEKQSKIANETEWYYTKLEESNSDLAKYLHDNSYEQLSTVKDSSEKIELTVKDMADKAVEEIKGMRNIDISETLDINITHTHIYKESQGSSSSSGGSKKSYAEQAGDIIGQYLKNSSYANASGRRDGPGGISQVNELGIELLATNDGQFIELNPHEKIFNNDQMNFLYDWSRRGIQSVERSLSSVSNYNEDSLRIDSMILELPNVTDSDSFANGLRNLREHIRNTKTIRRR